MDMAKDTHPVPAMPVNAEGLTTRPTSVAGLADAGKDSAAKGDSGATPVMVGGGQQKPFYNLDYIRILIMKNLSFPSSARKLGLKGKVTVAFILKKDGTVEDISILTSSGYEILDSNVVETISKIAPFPRPPGQAHVVLPIDYNIGL